MFNTQKQKLSPSPSIVECTDEHSQIQEIISFIKPANKSYGIIARDPYTKYLLSSSFDENPNINAHQLYIELLSNIFDSIVLTEFNIKTIIKLMKHPYVINKHSYTLDLALRGKIVESEKDMLLILESIENQAREWYMKIYNTCYMYNSSNNFRETLLHIITIANEISNKDALLENNVPQYLQEKLFAMIVMHQDSWNISDQCHIFKHLTKDVYIPKKISNNPSIELLSLENAVLSDITEILITDFYDDFWPQKKEHNIWLPKSLCDYYQLRNEEPEEDFLNLLLHRNITFFVPHTINGNKTIPSKMLFNITNKHILIKR